jgi:hypothetical protein
MIFEGVIGELRRAVGAQVISRFGPYSEQIVNDIGFGRYFEAARNKRMYGLSNVGFTVTANNLGALAAALQPITGFYNPIGNGRAAVIQRITTQTTVRHARWPAVRRRWRHDRRHLHDRGRHDRRPVAAGRVVDDEGVQRDRAHRLRREHRWCVPVADRRPRRRRVGCRLIPVRHRGGRRLHRAARRHLRRVTGTAAGTTHIVDAGLVWVEVDWPL